MRILVICTLLFAYAAAPKETSQKTVIFLGDSLTEGYGVDKDKAYPQLIANKLKKEGHKDIHVINAGISGSTSSSAPSRLRWLLKSHPSILFLALGANDGLRGIKAEVTKKNLAQAIQMAQKEKVKVILAGMQLPPNYGKAYGNDFQKIFPDLAKEYKVEFLPFLLKGVAADPKLNQNDGIHPNEKGHQVLADLVYPYIEKLL